MNTSFVRTYVTLIFTLLVTVAIGQSPVSVTISSAEGQQGETVCLDVILDTDVELTTFSFSLGYDKNVLEWDCSTSNDLSANVDPSVKNAFTFYSISCDNGNAVFGSFMEQSDPTTLRSIPLTAGTKLLTLCFKLIGDPGQYSDIVTSISAIVNIENSMSDIDNIEYDLTINPGTVKINPPSGQLALNIVSNCPDTNGGNDGSLVFSVLGGQGPYTYTLSNGNTGTLTAGNEVKIEDLPAGTYTIAIEDSSTSPISFSQSVTVGSSSSAMMINPTSSRIDCYGDNTARIAATISGGTAPYRYHWYNNSSGVKKSLNIFTQNNLVNDVYAGNYTLEVKDANGCVESTDFVVEEEEEIMIDDFFLGIKCNGGDTVLTGTIMGGVPSSSGYDLYYMDGARSNLGLNQVIASTVNEVLTSNNLYNLSDVKYIGVKDSKNCLVHIPVRIDTIQQPALIDPKLDSILNCDGYKVWVAPTGGRGGYTYSWAGSTDTDSLRTQLGDPSVTTDVTVTVTDANGCSEMQTLTLPAVQSGSTISIADVAVSENLKCHNGDNARITVNPSVVLPVNWNVEWYSDPSYSTMIDTLKNVFDAKNLTAGKYYLRFTHKTNMCQQDIVKEIINPAKLNIDANVLSDVTCSGKMDGKITVKASGGTPGGPGRDLYTGVIYDESGIEVNSKKFVGNVEFIDLDSKKYKVKVLDVNGCQDSTDIEIGSGLQFFVELDQANTSNKSCSNPVAKLGVKVTGGGGDHRYKWEKDGVIYDSNTFENDAIITDLTEGSYTVVVIDKNRCVAQYKDAILDKSQPDSGFKVTGEYKAVTFTPEYDPIKCYGEKTACLTVKSATGGSGSGYAFSVNNSVNYPLGECIELFAGQAEIVVFDAQGCASKPDTVIVEEPKEIVVNMDGTDQDNMVRVKLGEKSNIVTLSFESEFAVTGVKWTPADSLIFLNADSTIIQSTATSDQVHKIIVTDERGCVTTREFLVDVNKAKTVFTPNVFSPNNDNVNQTFSFFFPPSVASVANLTIYDMYGVPVFEEPNVTLSGDNYYSGWDGNDKRGREVEEGVYVWTAVIKYVDGSTRTLTRSLTLVR